TEIGADRYPLRERKREPWWDTTHHRGERHPRRCLFLSLSFPQSFSPISLLSFYVSLSVPSLLSFSLSPSVSLLIVSVPSLISLSLFPSVSLFLSLCFYLSLSLSLY